MGRKTLGKKEAKKLQLPPDSLFDKDPQTAADLKEGAFQRSCYFTDYKDSRPQVDAEFARLRAEARALLQQTGGGAVRSVHKAERHKDSREEIEADRRQLEQERREFKAEVAAEWRQIKATRRELDKQQQTIETYRQMIATAFHMKPDDSEDTSRASRRRKLPIYMEDYVDPFPPRRTRKVAAAAKGSSSEEEDGEEAEDEDDADEGSRSAVVSDTEPASVESPTDGSKTATPPAPRRTIQPAPLPAARQAIGAVPAAQLLEEEFALISSKPPPNCSVALPTAGDVFRWTATVVGPVGSAIEDVELRLELSFAFDYPHTPPKMTTVAGGISNESLAELTAPWTATSKVYDLLDAVSSLLSVSGSFAGDDPMHG
eukprot:TRINITY_DN1114_c0_g1_i6.p1 TRINITY_DN1114_c0_g1~~TRINITY_DN1114_c0_g1_i6.p1  ORF type:complete len:373 (-),score=119.83 TRINITY_DN1114_c0_g1_i6:97-1215(-)